MRLRNRGTRRRLSGVVVRPRGVHASSAPVSAVCSGIATTSVQDVGEGVGLGPITRRSPIVGGAEHRRRNGGPVTDGYSERTPSRRRSRDRGQTFVEILVAIVLLGTAVSGTLTALRATIVSGEVDEGQAKAHAWLLAAADAIQRTEYKSCSLGVGAVTSAYDTAVQTAPAPEGWGGGGVGVNVVDFWNKSNGAEVWSDDCGTEVSAQLVEIYVLSPTGDVGKTMQVVKRGG